MPVGGGGLTGSPGGVSWKLQADFSGTAFGGTPTWTDITGWWMSSPSDPGGSSASIPWGRQDQASTVEGATTSFVLNNSDGRFTPGRATLVNGSANPYFPNVRRHVRMRLTATDGTTTDTVVDGLVDTWDVTPQTDGPTLSTAALSDPFGRLSASATLRSLYAEEVLLDSPISAYMLTEETGSTSFGDLLSNAAAPLTNSKYGAAAASAGSEIAGVVIGTGVSFTNSAITSPQTVITLPASAVPSSSAQFTFEAWIASTASPGVGQTIVEAGRLDSPGSLKLTTSGTGVSVALSAGAGVSGTATANDGQAHHVVGTFDGSTLSIYFDGALLNSASRSPTGFSPIVGYIGGSFAYSNTLEAGFTGTIAGVAIYSTALSATRILAHYNAGKTALAGESTSARWARLLTYRPNIGGTTTGTVGTVGSADTAGQSLGDALTEVAVAEGGVVDTSRGTLRLIGRLGLRNPAPVLTLDAALGQVDLPTTWRDDPQGFTNDVSVNRPNGATQRRFNATSITADGSSQTSVTANVNTDRDAADMAGWLVAVGTQEAITSPSLTVNLYARASSALTLAVCALKTYDTVKLINLPASAPASTMTLQVQGGTLTVGASECSAQLFTTAQPPVVLQLDNAATPLDGPAVLAW